MTKKNEWQPTMALRHCVMQFHDGHRIEWIEQLWTDGTTDEWRKVQRHLVPIPEELSGVY